MLTPGIHTLSSDMLPEHFIGKKIKVGSQTLVVNQVGPITENLIDQVGYQFMSINPKRPKIELDFGDIFQVL